MGVKAIKDPITGKVKLVSDQPKAGNPTIMFNGVQSMNVVNTEDGPLPLVYVGGAGSFDMVGEKSNLGLTKKLKHLMLGKAQTISLDVEDKAQSEEDMALLQLTKYPVSGVGMDPEMDKHLLNFEVMADMLTNSFDCEFKFVFGTKLRVQIPHEMMDKTKKSQMGELLDYATRYGYLSQPEPGKPTLHYSMGGSSVPVMQKEITPYIMLMGGPRNGDIIASAESSFVSMSMPPAGLFASFHADQEVVPPSQMTTRYYRELVGFQCKGMDTTAAVFRHESIPTGNVASMFEMMLEEFPLLRCIPMYSLFWWGKKS